jgi:plastocyanin
MGRRTRFGHLIAIIGLLAVVLGGCGGDSNGNASGGNGGGGSGTRLAISDGGIADPERTDVSIVNFAFEPDPYTTSAGSTVWWVNDGSAPHTVNSAEFGDDFTSSGTIRTGNGFAWTFEEPGEYAYFCNNHPGMEGTIIVE